MRLLTVLWVAFSYCQRKSHCNNIESKQQTDRQTLQSSVCHLDLSRDLASIVAIWCTHVAASARCRCCVRATPSCQRSTHSSVSRSQFSIKMSCRRDFSSLRGLTAPAIHLRADLRHVLNVFNNNNNNNMQNVIVLWDFMFSFVNLHIIVFVYISSFIRKYDRRTIRGSRSWNLTTQVHLWTAQRFVRESCSKNEAVGWISGSGGSIPVSQ